MNVSNHKRYFFIVPRAILIVSATHDLIEGELFEFLFIQFDVMSPLENKM